jgi:type IV pilus assembly protein PilO
MTFADDFASEDQNVAGNYPSAFGITFTPIISGVAIGVSGIALAVYGFINYVNPAHAKYTEASTKKQELQGQLAQIKTGDLQLELAQLESDLAAQKVLRSRVISMFTSEQDLDTLLIDLDNFAMSNQANLMQYQPDGNLTTIDDDSLGTDVKGKLKKQSFSLALKGTFTETKQILQDLERLQPLLMIQSISSTVEDKPTGILTSSNSQIVSQKQAELKTEIKLDAILPSSQAEFDAAKKADELASNEELAKGKNRRERRENSDKAAEITN